MRNNCIVCSRISKIKINENPFFVVELETGYVVLGDFQYFTQVSEITQMPDNQSIYFYTIDIQEYINSILW